MIQWFPGHMLETEKLLKDAVSKVDMVLEIVDARLPVSSSNPLLEKLCKNCFKLKILNKKDLADDNITDAWVQYFNSKKEHFAVPVKATDQKDAHKALNFGMNKISRNKARKTKVMVIGIPNTGKSTILNSLAGKKIAKTGNVPAVTRHKQRTSLKNNIDIYDTPGILWPVIEPPKRAYILAASGAVSDTAVEYDDIGFFAAEFLISRYPDLLLKRYNFLESVPKEPEELINEIGKRGCLKKGGLVNLTKACKIIVQELRSGKIGKISFETPKDLIIENETI